MTCYLNIALWISVMEALEQWESSVIILASTRPDRQQKKGMHQQKWEQIQQEEKLNPQQVKIVGWKHFCVGTQQWDEDAMQGLRSVL